MFGASLASNSIDTVLGLGFLFTNREIICCGNLNDMFHINLRHFNARSPDGCPLGRIRRSGLAGGSKSGGLDFVVSKGCFFAVFSVFYLSYPCDSIS